MSERREVRIAGSFFEELDSQLGPERGPNGEPSATDFIVIDLSDDPLISASLSVVDAYSVDLREATDNQRWAIKVAHKHGASLRQLAEDPAAA